MYGPREKTQFILKANRAGVRMSLECYPAYLSSGSGPPAIGSVYCRAMAMRTASSGETR